MAGRPAWRRAFDRAERAIGGPLEQMIDTRRFASALVVMFRAQGIAYGLMERNTRMLLHLWNMPARTDIKRLNRQVAILATEVRRLAEELERKEAAAAEKSPPRKNGSARKATPARKSASSNGSQRKTAPARKPAARKPAARKPAASDG